MTAPAALGSAIAYRHMLAASGLPLTVAHAAFEEQLDAMAAEPTWETSDEEEPAAGLDVAAKRAILLAGIRDRGEDITGRQMAGAAQ